MQMKMKTDDDRMANPYPVSAIFYQLPRQSANPGELSPPAVAPTSVVMAHNRCLFHCCCASTYFRGDYAHNYRQF